MVEIKYLSIANVRQLNLKNICVINNVKTYTDGVNKMIMIPLLNMFNETLTAITIKLTQYDAQNNRLKREIINIEDLSVKPRKLEIDKELHKVDVMMDHIDIEIIGLKFVTLIYDNGTLSSTYIKQDKKALRKFNKLAKKAKKHPEKVAKKFKEQTFYNFETIMRKKGCLTATLACVFLLVAVITVGLLICGIFSEISIFYIDFFKGGLL